MAEKAEKVARTAVLEPPAQQVVPEITPGPNPNAAVRAAADPQLAPAGAVLDLQRFGGNQFVAQAAAAAAQRAEREYYDHLAQHIFDHKTARILEWSPAEERDRTRVAFQIRYQEDMLFWLWNNVPHLDARVRSFAWVCDGLDSLPHVDLALAFYTGRMRVPPVDLLAELNLKGRRETKRLFERTYFLFLRHRWHSLEGELINFYENLWGEKFQRSIALLHHDLTPAEQLYFYGVGKLRPGVFEDVEVPRATALIRDIWAKGGYAGMRSLDADWANYVHDDIHWWPLPNFPWTRLYLYQAVDESIRKEPYRGEALAILRAYEEMKQDRKDREDKPGPEEDLEFELRGARRALEAAVKAKNEDEARQVLKTWHAIWARFLAIPRIKGNAELRKQYEEAYTRHAAALQTGGMKGFSAFKQAQLTPEDRLLGFAGDTPKAFADEVTRLWLEHGEDFEYFVKERGNGQMVAGSLTVALRSGLDARRIAALLKHDASQAERGYARLMIELTPDRSTTIGKDRSDTELQPVYEFLNTTGMAPRLRNGIVRTFVEKQIPSSSRRLDGKGDWESPNLTFLRYIGNAFEGERGRWFLQLEDLLDPPSSRMQRVERQTKKFHAGRSGVLQPIVPVVRGAWDWLRREHQDPEGAAWAGIKNIAASETEGLRETLAGEHGVQAGQELIGILQSASDRRIGYLHAREDEIAAVVAGMIEVGVEALLSTFLGPAGWAQMAATFGAAVAGILAREQTMGTAYASVTAANIKTVGMAVLGSYLFDARDIRGEFAKHFNVNRTPFLQRIAMIGKGGHSLADRTQHVVVNALAGIHDQGISLAASALWETITTTDYPNVGELEMGFYQALLRTGGRMLHGGLRTFEVNPGTVYNSMKYGARFANNAEFKVWVKALEGLAGKEVEAYFKDDYFTLNDALNVAVVTLTKSVAGLLVKSLGTTTAQHMAAATRVPLARRWRASAKPEEIQEVLGAVVENNWPLRKEFERLKTTSRKDDQWEPDQLRRAGLWLIARNVTDKQIAIEISRAIDSAVKTKYGKIQEDFFHRTLAAHQRKQEALADSTIKRRLKEDPNRVLHLAGVVAIQRSSTEYFEDLARTSLAPGPWALLKIYSGDLALLRQVADHIEKDWDAAR